MQPFIVTFRFATMPILRGACTLDAVLGGEIARGVDDLETAIGMTPLAGTDGVFHGSSLILLDDTGVAQPVPVVLKEPGGLLRRRSGPGVERAQACGSSQGEEPPEPV